MEKKLLSRMTWLFLLVIIVISGHSCESEDEVKKHFASLTWGGWLLQGAIIPNQTGVTAIAGDQYLERNYKGFVITGPAQTTEIDSVVLYRNRQIIFAGQVAEELSRDVNRQKIVYRLTNNKYYWIQLIPVDGAEDGTGNDQLLVSDFVNSRQDLDKATVYKYVRTNFGKRPW